MLPYQQQLVYKQQQVYDNLKRIGKISLPEFLPIAGAVETRFYRNKLEYTFSTKEYTEAPPRPFPAGSESSSQMLLKQETLNNKSTSQNIANCATGCFIYMDKYEHKFLLKSAVIGQQLF